VPSPALAATAPVTAPAQAPVTTPAKASVTVRGSAGEESVEPEVKEMNARQAAWRKAW
jgi:hypothetical protein